MQQWKPDIARSRNITLMTIDTQDADANLRNSESPTGDPETEPWAHEAALLSTIGNLPPLCAMISLRIA